MDHRAVARRLSKAAAELLLDHVDGTAFVEAPFTVHDPSRKRTALALMDSGLIRFVGYGARPSRTRITEDGRAVLCFVLADYADALTAAGYAIGRLRPTAISETAKMIADSMPKPSVELPVEA